MTPRPDPANSLPRDPDVVRTDVHKEGPRAVPTLTVLRERWDVLLVIGVGGSLGAAARWGVSEALATARGGFPLATFLVNVSGSFLLGVLMVLVTDRWPPSRYRRPFLGVGVLGGFTTFSTFELEARQLVAGGRGWIALAYVLGSLVAGLAAVAVGILLTRRAAR